MSCNWPLKRISEVANFENNKRIPLKSLDREKRQGIYPYYGASGVVDYIDDFIFDGRYLLISEDGENLRTRNTSIAFQASGKFWVNNHAHILSEKEEGILDYLEYYFSVLNIGAYITGAVQPKLNKANLDKIEIPIPPKDEMLKLNNVLNSLKYKVTLNSQTNQTLEQMAQAIFKSWFVDFDPVKAKMRGEQPEGMDEATASLFPEKLVESELGLIPEGWDVASIKDFGDVICGKTPSKKNADFYGGDVPFIKIPDTHGKVFITETTDTLTKAGDASQPKKRIPENSICVSCIATVGQVFITTKPSHTNQQINSVVPNDTNSLYYLLFTFKGLHKHFHDLASGGSATLNMNTSTFSKVVLVRPTIDLLEAFHKTVGGLMEKMLANQLENSTLSELRDTLLPKLLSGEIELDSVVAK